MTTLPAAVTALLALTSVAAVAGQPAKPTIAVLNTNGCADERHIDTLRSLGNVIRYDETDTDAKVRERLRNADIAIAQPFTAPLKAQAFASVKRLKLLVVCTTGYDNVDVAAATEHGVLVANTRSYSTESVAEHAIALMLAVSRRIPVADAAMRRKPFEALEGVPEHMPYMGFDLAGKTLGIIGLGRIGSRVAQIASQGFGMKVLAYDRSPHETPGVTFASLDDLLKQSDVVSMHLSLSKDTAQMLNAPRLALMKPTAILINTARGKLVDEAALYRALQTGQIAGAGLDTLDDTTANNPLLSLQNVVLSPHSAYFTQESTTRRAEEIVATVKAFVADAPVNIVNPRR
jgi:D-3-phosphoglycerate dehydrogenase